MPPWKRAVDILFCLLALPLLSFGCLVMTVVTCLVSRGPILFRQERVGFAGSRFKVYKFRTMRVGADPATHQVHVRHLVDSNAPMVKLDAGRDPRLIAGGWILRASGMDELPQIINVLRGEMSLVGPRPCIPGEFERHLPCQSERFDAVPGLTGLWQVSGKNRTTFDEMIRLDIAYARNVSPLIDAKIILLTPWALAVQICDTCVRRKSAVRAAPVLGSEKTAA